MKKVSELTGAELDYWVARALGYRFWLEQRGEYRLSVLQAPGDREPWRSSRTGSPDRYTETHSFAEIQCGFFGVGVPKFSNAWADGGPIIALARIAVAPYCSAQWVATVYGSTYVHGADLGDDVDAIGPTPLIAAMRAYVASKFGDTVPAE